MDRIENIKRKKQIFKSEFPMFKYKKILNNCYFCEYANKKFRDILYGKICLNKHNYCESRMIKSMCELCIDTNQCDGLICNSKNSLYKQFTDCDPNDYMRLGSIALKIANLPFERKLL